MSLHADVAVPARDRHRLERLCCYVARPPLVNDRLDEHAEGGLLLRRKTRWQDGTTHVFLERSELIDRLVPLIPPPRAHRVRYHGILPPCASLRRRVVPAAHEFELGLPAALGDAPNRDAHAAASASANRPAQSRPDDDRPREDRPDKRPRRLRWAALLQRVFEIDALRCPRCGSTLLIAAIEDPAIARSRTFREASFLCLCSPRTIGRRMATPTNRALWYAFIASLFLYAVVANVLHGPTSPEAPIGLLAAAFASLSVVIAIATIAYRRRALAGPIAAGRLDPTTPAGVQKAFPVFILNLALSESVGIYGFVLSLLSGRPIYVLIFATGALALLYVHRPTAPDLVPPHPGFAISDRPPPIG